MSGKQSGSVFTYLQLQGSDNGMESEGRCPEHHAKRFQTSSIQAPFARGVLCATGGTHSKVTKCDLLGLNR